ncbi:hypothetical protein NL533_34150, partial [Klebsiella pneumoniae]|nr:hypothetical protein [Klebsiella pneumoniae]
VVLVGVNLAMWGLARSLRGFNTDVFKNFGDATRPWKKEDEGLKELNERVRALKSDQDDTQTP